MQLLKEGGSMQKSIKDSQINDAEKLEAAGNKSIAVSVDAWLKEMIDEECKRADCTIAHVITKSVVNFVASSATWIASRNLF